MTDVALVTGGAGSIGRRTCDRLGAMGFAVVMADIEPPDDASEHTFQVLDVCSRDSVEQSIERASQLGPLRVLVNCHGVGRRTVPTEVSEEDMRSVIDPNLEGVIRMIDAAAPVLADGSAVVSLSSAAAQHGRANHALVYAATKAGVEALTRNYAIALGRRGIRVNAVAPGFVLEPMKNMGGELRKIAGGTDAIAEKNPMGRLPTADEVADVVAYLCSPNASAVSGVVIPVDTAMAAE